MRRFGLAMALLLPPVAIASAIPANASEPAAPTGAVAGTWFYDRDEDGQQQPAEPGADTFSVEIATPDGEHVTAGYTGADGAYRIGDLAPGDYLVRFGSDGYKSTTAEEVPVTVKADGTARVDFGMRGGAISGMAWRDLNGDGQRQDGEPPIPDMPVRMDGSNEPVARTGPEGKYRIDDLWLAGTTDYSVYFERRAGTRFSPPRVGDSPTDSDVIDFDEGTAQARIWVGRPGIVDATDIDAGYVPS